jgi:hypothetical protein
VKYFQTHYDNLKVSRDAPPEVIRLAYRALASKYHPDRNPNCEKSLLTMQLINAAYEVLSDPEKRRRHDIWISTQEAIIEAKIRNRMQSASVTKGTPTKQEKPTEQAPPFNTNTPNGKDYSSDALPKWFTAFAVIVITLTVMWVIFALANEPTQRLQSGSDPTPRVSPNPPPTPTGFNAPALSPPRNGTVINLSNDARLAPFEIRSNRGRDYVVKLTSSITGEDAMIVFVRGGQTVETEAPLGRFMVKYASGNTWYGYEHLFGPDTIYSKADGAFDFKRTMSPSAQSRLIDLQRQLSSADANFRAFLNTRGIALGLTDYIFDGINPDTGQRGIDRLPPEYWRNLLGVIRDINFHNEIVRRLNGRNNISNQIIQLRNSEERIEGYTITLYGVVGGNLKTSRISADQF